MTAPRISAHSRQRVPPRGGDNRDQPQVRDESPDQDGDDPHGPDRHRDGSADEHAEHARDPDDPALPEASRPLGVPQQHHLDARHPAAPDAREGGVQKDRRVDAHGPGSEQERRARRRREEAVAEEVSPHRYVLVGQPSYTDCCAGCRPAPRWGFQNPGCTVSMPEIDADAILPNDRVQESVADGEVTQLTRGAGTRYATEGDTFEIGGETFAVASVERRTLGEFTDADARREGSESLDAYKRRMERVHPEGFTWDDTEAVLTYRFERAE
jgi:hypothetical protein